MCCKICHAKWIQTLKIYLQLISNEDHLFNDYLFILLHTFECKILTVRLTYIITEIYLVLCDRYYTLSLMFILTLSKFIMVSTMRKQRIKKAKQPAQGHIAK